MTDQDVDATAYPPAPPVEGDDEDLERYEAERAAYRDAHPPADPSPPVGDTGQLVDGSETSPLEHLAG